MRPDSVNAHRVPMYRGKTTSCYAQALVTAFPSVFSTMDTWLVDALTTVPFGVVYRPNDPNRLLDSYLDPDLGLDRALMTLGIACKTTWWNQGTDSLIPLRQLMEWCEKGPVVLGPLDMGYLPYLFHAELFAGMDHYIIATRVDHQRVWLCDTEAVPCASVTHEELILAWKASQILEGRGEFVMRRLTTAISPVNCAPEALALTFRLASSNLLAAEAHEMGGKQGISALADEESTILQNSSLRRGLTYALPTRIQRCEFGRRFVNMLASSGTFMVPASLWDRCVLLLEEQEYLYADTLALILEAKLAPLQLLQKVAVLEEQLTALFNEIAGMLE